LDKEQVSQIAVSYAIEVLKHLKPYKIILYGSYAYGSPREDSDIDIAVVFNGFKGDLLEVSSLLWRLRRPINILIEPILLDTKDDYLIFNEEVLKKGIVIYQQ
jgi:predicted nucleotidyltransferase